MLPLLALLVALLAAQSRAERVFYALEDAEHHFDQFIATFNKQYANEEERNFRFNIFRENLNKINEKNSLENAVFGITRFTDLTTEEFQRKYTGLRLDPTSVLGDIECKVINGSLQEISPAPDSLDWRDKGKVTKIKDQEDCQSNWAFSAIGNLEGLYAIKHNKLIDMSTQQLIDCDGSIVGCRGGSQYRAMIFLSESGGLMMEKDYPYINDEADCQFNKSKVVLQVTACNLYYHQTEDQKQQLLADVGPLAINIYAPDDFQMYKSGILECDKRHNAYSALLVGYGKEGDNSYWIVKNSWGEKWGEKGYARFAMHKNNSCKFEAIAAEIS